MLLCFPALTLAVQSSPGAITNTSSPKTVITTKKPLKPSPQELLANPEAIPHLLQSDKITAADIPNPHWRINACTACHRTKSKAGKNNLRMRNIDVMCNTCHQILSAHSFIHVSDIKVPKSMLQRMPATFRSSIANHNNNMTCITCHDLPMTCLPKRHKEQGLNPKFFRGGPYKSRTGLCYKCHDVKKYQRVNAHDQIDDKGRVRKDKCLICHAANQDMKTANILDDVEFNLKDNLSRLCWGCHPWKPHPGGSFTFFSGKGGTPNHLVRPSKSILQRMNEKQKENKILLPLEPGTGKIFCATCHNPHEKGVIKLERAAKGADSKSRLRSPGICINCHDK